jgi:L-alanine-DL-glutamate epimerase-like enolase superfamily enzyme
VLIEQPLPAKDDGALASVARPVPVCADESAHDRASLATLAGKYDMINIKLDKTGGLTEALLLAGAAREHGLAVMVGCMVSTSLSIAPAILLAQADASSISTGRSFSRKIARMACAMTAASSIRPGPRFGADACRRGASVATPARTPHRRDT